MYLCKLCLQLCYISKEDKNVLFTQEHALLTQSKNIFFFFYLNCFQQQFQKSKNKNKKNPAKGVSWVTTLILLFSNRYKKLKHDLKIGYVPISNHPCAASLLFAPLRWKASRTHFDMYKLAAAAAAAESETHGTSSLHETWHIDEGQRGFKCANRRHWGALNESRLCTAPSNAQYQY